MCMTFCFIARAGSPERWAGWSLEPPMGSRMSALPIVTGPVRKNCGRLPGENPGPAVLLSAALVLFTVRFDQANGGNDPPINLTAKKTNSLLFEE